MDFPEVIYEDNHLLILNKPAGWLSQGDQTGDIAITDWAKEYIREKYNKPGNVFAGLPHRIDRPVSGIIVICRTSKSLERMTRLFADKNVKKTYLAAVSPAPPTYKGKLENWLVKDHARNKTKALTAPGKGGKHSVLSYELVEALRKGYLLEVYPETGRPHQIRAQLAKVGSPIIGDLKYGGERSVDKKAIGLHAFRIEFEHPVKKETVQFESDPETNPVLRNLKHHG